MSQLLAEHAYISISRGADEFVSREWSSIEWTDIAAELQSDFNSIGTGSSSPSTAARHSTIFDVGGTDLQGMHWSNVHSSLCCPTDLCIDSRPANDRADHDPIDHNVVDFDLVCVYGDTVDVSLKRRTASRGLLNAWDCNDVDADPLSADRHDDEVNVDSDHSDSADPMQVIFTRNHNRIAVELAQDHPAWSDEKLYQEARALNLAEYRSMVCDGWVKSVLAARALPPCAGYCVLNRRSSRPLRSINGSDDVRVKLRGGDRFNYLEESSGTRITQARATFKAAQAIVDDLCFKGWCRLLLLRPSAAVRRLATMCQLPAMPAFIAWDAVELN